jgi:hypothetical protein
MKEIESHQPDANHMFHTATLEWRGGQAVINKVGLEALDDCSPFASRPLATPEAVIAACWRAEKRIETVCNLVRR